MTDWIQQLKAAQQLKKLPLAKLISLFESTLPEHATERKALCQHIQQHPSDFSKLATIIGFTGTPGAGKSSLIAELCRTLLAKHTDISIAVLAIDPSSQISGGSILGDRTRMRLGQKQPRLFFRSQASNLELGGITESTFQACRILRHLFDFIIIETVGIGQNEIDIQYLTDHTYLVMQPLAGDQIQFMKCGIMEVPDSFVVNKCDEESLARSSYHMLKSSLKQAKLIEADDQSNYQQTKVENIFLSSTVTGKGIEELGEHLIQISHRKPFSESELFYLKKHIQKGFGEFGLREVNQLETGGAFNNIISFEEKEKLALEAIQKKIIK